MADNDQQLPAGLGHEEGSVEKSPIKLRELTRQRGHREQARSHI